MTKDNGTDKDIYQALNEVMERVRNLLFNLDFYEEILTDLSEDKIDFYKKTQEMVASYLDLKATGDSDE